jgi:hypothetical protein
LVTIRLLLSNKTVILLLATTASMDKAFHAWPKLWYPEVWR